MCFCLWFGALAANCFHADWPRATTGLGPRPKPLYMYIDTRVFPAHIHARSEADPREVVQSIVGSEQHSAIAPAASSKPGAAPSKPGAANCEHRRL